jgi:hypothetical protein
MGFLLQCILQGLYESAAHSRFFHSAVTYYMINVLWRSEITFQRKNTVPKTDISMYRYITASFTELL